MQKFGSGDGTVAPHPEDPQGVEVTDPAQHTAAQQAPTDADQAALAEENERADSGEQNPGQV